MSSFAFHMEMENDFDNQEEEIVLNNTSNDECDDSENDETDGNETETEDSDDDNFYPSDIEETDCPIKRAVLDEIAALGERREIGPALTEYLPFEFEEEHSANGCIGCDDPVPFLQPDMTLAAMTGAKAKAFVRRVVQRDPTTIAESIYLEEAIDSDDDYEYGEKNGFDVDDFDPHECVMPANAQLFNTIDDIVSLVQQCHDSLKYIELMMGDVLTLMRGPVSWLISSPSIISAPQMEELVLRELALMADIDPQQKLFPARLRFKHPLSCPHFDQRHAEMLTPSSACLLPYAHLLLSEVQSQYDLLEEYAEQLEDIDDLQHGLRAETTTEMLEWVDSFVSPVVASAKRHKLTEHDLEEFKVCDETLLSIGSLHITDREMTDECDHAVTRKRKRTYGADTSAERANDASRIVMLMQSIRTHSQPYAVDDVYSIEGRDLIADVLRDYLPDEDVIIWCSNLEYILIMLL